MTLFDLIRLSLWNDGTDGEMTVTPDDFLQMKQHAIAALPVSHLSRMNLPPDVKKEWADCVVRQLSYYTKNYYEQCNLPITVPYVILKGTSAAQYYPYPEYRMMGDIDVMTRREDLNTACWQLREHGYRVIKELNREISLEKSGIVIEVHRRFATLNDPDQAKYLDDLIIGNITPSHVLPDMINGLVLLEHIDQHMEEGVGLRQIIDWMMFVDKCLPDDKWPEFETHVNHIGLKKLAIVVTHMCELFLGLPLREWCSQANESLCVQLMDYVLSSGNFGCKKTTDSNISENVFAFTGGSIKTAFKLLQKQGKKNWHLAQKHPFLRPVAWVYQLFRYVSRGLKRDNAVSKIKAEYVAARKRTAMFDALGVKTEAKGNVIYKNGQYVKE